MEVSIDGGRTRFHFFCNIRQRNFDSAAQAPSLVTLTNMGPELLSQNPVDVNYEKKLM